ncbi:MAG: LysR family transcriptional regulator [Verrucomicrobiota bacterium]
MQNWEDLKLAYLVSQQGSVSAAARALKVHRATIIRAIDSLEESLGQPVFTRHNGSYIPTEEGCKIFMVAKNTFEQLENLSESISPDASALEGPVKITTFHTIGQVFLPTVKAFLEKHPKVEIQLLTVGLDNETKISEYFSPRSGLLDADIALWPGPEPDFPGKIVKMFGTAQFALFATAEYILRRGMPESIEELKTHSFVCRPAEPIMKFEHWLRETIPQERLSVKATDPTMIHKTILSGICIGFLPTYAQNYYPELVQVMESRPDWNFPVWLVLNDHTYRTERVKAFLKLFEEDKTFKKDD